MGAFASKVLMTCQGEYSPALRNKFNIYPTAPLSLQRTLILLSMHIFIVVFLLVYLYVWNIYISVMISIILSVYILVDLLLCMQHTSVDVPFLIYLHHTILIKCLLGWEAAMVKENVKVDAIASSRERYLNWPRTRQSMLVL